MAAGAYASGMPEATLTRSVRLHALHRYHRPDWSDGRNREVFGAQGELHGHDYLIEVSVRGEVNPATGFCVELSALDEAIRGRIIEPAEGTALHQSVQRFGPGGLQPSTEELARWVWEEIAPTLAPGVRMQRVRVCEDESLRADYHGDGGGAHG